jgi:hypothetical protein
MWTTGIFYVIASIGNTIVAIRGMTKHCGKNSSANSLILSCYSSEVKDRMIKDPQSKMNCQMLSKFDAVLLLTEFKQRLFISCDNYLWCMSNIAVRMRHM